MGDYWRRVTNVFWPPRTPQFLSVGPPQGGQERIAVVFGGNDHAAAVDDGRRGVAILIPLGIEGPGLHVPERLTVQVEGVSGDRFVVKLSDEQTLAVAGDRWRGVRILGVDAAGKA